QQQSVEPLASTKSSCSIENQHYILKVNEQGSIVSLKLKSLDKEINFQQNFSYYASSSSDGKSQQQSG
ncbi:unnamed protein product, partial [Rotaria magnacalcarata]